MRGPCVPEAGPLRDIPPPPAHLQTAAARAAAAVEWWFEQEHPTALQMAWHCDRREVVVDASHRLVHLRQPTAQMRMAPRCCTTSTLFLRARGDRRDGTLVAVEQLEDVQRADTARF